jgi:uncharacterized protein
MKLLIVIVAFAVLWLLLRGLVRRTRNDGAPRASAPPRDDGTPQPMLSCAQCGLHLPRDEALPGRGGVFCGEAHRAAYERQHPAP